MAKIKVGQIALLGAVGVGALGVFGKLPPSIQSAFSGITRPGTAGATPAGPTTVPAIPGCNNAFIPGIQYVAPFGTGFVVVLNSQVVYQSQSQTDAEQWYNVHVCMVKQ